MRAVVDHVTFVMMLLGGLQYVYNMIVCETMPTLVNLEENATQ